MNRLTIRARLTLMYAGLFLAGGLILIGVMAVSVHGNVFAEPPRDAIGAALRDSGLAAARPAQPADEVRHAAAEAFERRVREELRDQAVRRLAWTSGGVLAGLVVLSAAAGWLVAGRALGRLRRVTDAARHASETTLHERLNLAGPADEIKELGDTFDAMLARLDTAFDAQRRFVANASHELRTPLAVARTAVDVTLAKPRASPAQLRAMGEDVRDATVRAQQLIDSLLALATSEAQRPGDDLDDLADLAAEAVDAVRREAAAAGVRVTAELTPAPVRGDVPLLGRAVANLVENAVRYNVPGGEVTVTVTVAPTRLVVANTGPAVDPQLLPRLFEPFHRGPRTRLDGGGAGLGLSIVRSVAEGHHGSVTAAANPGGGLTVTLTLPAAHR